MTSEKNRAEGTIITFYSYKGGTGRSMSLANVAWILASNGLKVLVIDWDLEAPGLHRYFSPFLIDKELTSTEGLIDFIGDYVTETMTQNPDGKTPDPDWYLNHADILQYAVSLDYRFPSGGMLDLVPAGRQGSTYSTRVNVFNWQTFYDRLGGGAFFEAAKQKMRLEYDYILIDSRTGVSDTSGICTVQMPDTLVVCFTLNNQSIEGASAVAESAFSQRTARPLRIFPVQMRVEPFEKRKLDLRKEFAKARFARFPDHIPSRRERDIYMEEVQFQYIPFYAYEELLAAFGDRPEESISLLKPAERLTSYLTDGRVSRLADPPNKEKREEILAVYEGRVLDIDPAIAQAAAAFNRLTAAEQVVAQGVLKRLVRVTSPSEGGEDTASSCRFDEMDAESQAIVRKLADEEVVTIEPGSTPGMVVRLTNDILIKKWEPLRQWLNEDRDFLLWRRKINDIIAEWERLDQDQSALLTGALLAEAKAMRARRSSDLSPRETGYIDRSIAAEHQHQTVLAQVESTRIEREQEIQKLRAVTQKQNSQRWVTLAIAAAVIVIGAGVFFLFQSNRQQKIEAATRLTLDGNEALKNGNYDDAISKFSQAIESNPNNEIAYYSRGRAYHEKKDFDRAIADFDRAIGINPQYNDAFLARGISYLEKSDYDRALSDLNISISLKDSADARYFRGKIYEIRKDLQRALADYNAAIKLSPEDPRPYVGRGISYAQSGDYERALGTFNQALSLKPDYYEAYLGRGNVYLAQGQNDRAVTDYEQSIKINSYDPYAWLNRAIAYKNLGRRDQAAESYQRARDLAEAEPKNEQIIQSSEEGLKELNIGSTDATQQLSASNPKVYLHYQDDRDLAAINAINQALTRSGKFSSGGKPDLVSQPTTGDVRYFYQEDSQNAQEIKRLVERTLGKRGIDLKLETRFLSGLAHKVPQGWIEVWLPSLPAPDKRRPPRSGVSPVYQQRLPEYSKND